jgi:DnaK suppressor protein
MEKRKLKEYEKKLKEKKEEILSAILSSKTSGDESISEMVQDVADKASTSYSRELLYGLSDTERKIFFLIEEALKRIKEGKYGICVHCQKPIQKKRLDAVPWARHCIECQELQERGIIK